MNIANGLIEFGCMMHLTQWSGSLVSPVRLKRFLSICLIVLQVQVEVLLLEVIFSIVLL